MIRARISPTPNPFLATIAVTLLTFFLAGCGGGGGGGSASQVRVLPLTVSEEFEPNDSFANAMTLDPGIGGAGELTDPGDTDYWTFLAVAGQVISIELQAMIVDPDAWRASCNFAEFDLYGPDETPLCRVDFDHFGGLRLDADITHFLVTASGPHTIRVRQDNATTTGGRYTILWRDADPGDLQFEGEAPGTSGANDSIATAETISPGWLWGFYVDSESDYYAFTIDGPSRVYFEIEGHRTGALEGQARHYDSYLRLYNESGSELHARDDSFYLDSAIQEFLPQAGTYYVRVTEWSGNPNSGEYFLRFEQTAADADPIPATGFSDTAEPIDFGELVYGETSMSGNAFYDFEGVAGDLVRLETYAGSTFAGGNGPFSILGPDGFQVATSVGEYNTRAILRDTGTHTIVAGAPPLTRHAFRLLRIREATFETAPLDTLGGATTIGEIGAHAGRITGTDPVDLYRFTSESGTQVSFSIYAGTDVSFGARDIDQHGSTLVPRLRILDEDGFVLQEAFTDTCGRPHRPTNNLADLEIAVQTPADEGGRTLYLEVTAVSGAGEDGVYLVERTR